MDVFERSQELGEVGAGLHVSPNGARVLIDLGLGEAIDQVAVRPRQRVMRLGNTGEGWGLHRGRIWALSNVTVRRICFCTGPICTPSW